MPKIITPTRQDFNGQKYFKSGDYYNPAWSPRAKGSRSSWTPIAERTALHRAVWQHYSGETIPKWYVVHHIDGNKDNNEFSNLQCLSASDHMRLHGAERRANGTARKGMPKGCVEASVAWRKTPEGIARLAQINRKVPQRRHEHTCVQCGRQYFHPHTPETSVRKTFTYCCDGTCWRRRKAGLEGGPIRPQAIKRREQEALKEANFKRHPAVNH